jgi:hypothetical protein
MGQDFYAPEDWVAEFLLPAVRQQFEPRTMFEWTILLPFDVGVDESASLVDLKPEAGSILTFNRTGVEMRYEAGVLDESEVSRVEFRTRATLFFFTTDDVITMSQTDETVLVDFTLASTRVLLGRLNDALAKLTLISNNDDVQRLTEWNVSGGMTRPRIVPLPGWDGWVSALYAHRLSPEVIPQERDVSGNVLDAWIQAMTLGGSLIDRLILAEELRFEGAKHLRAGAYRESVVLSQSATEVLLRTFHDAMDPDREGNPSFRDLVKVVLPRMLGGDWSLKGTGPVAAWWQDCYNLRNRVSHEGFQPSELEAIDTLDAVENLWTWTSDRLKETSGADDIVRALRQIPWRPSWVAPLH